MPTTTLHPPIQVQIDCPVCKSRDLIHVLSLEAVPVLCNVLYSNEASARMAGTGRFSMAFCRRCAHVFNAAFDRSRIDYTQGYENSLHYSPRFTHFVEELTQRLNDTYALSGKTVIDVGCGKGDFLTLLCRLSGAEGIGFDRSYEENRNEGCPGVRFVNDWFSGRYADFDLDLLTCRHVIEHVSEPITFLRELRSHPAVKAESVFYFEVPNALYTLQDLGIWDLIYEHVSYFTPCSLKAACEAAGFDILGMQALRSAASTCMWRQGPVVRRHRLGLRATLRSTSRSVSSATSIVVRSKLGEGLSRCSKPATPLSGAVDRKASLS